MRQKCISIEKCYCIILMILMASMIIVPVSYQKHKMLILVILCGGVFYSVVKRKCYIPIDIVRVLLLYILYNTVSVVIGITTSAPGAVRVTSTEIVWPILFVVLFLAFPAINVIDYVFTGIILGMWVVSLMDFALLMTAYGIFPLQIEWFTQIDLGYYVNPAGHAFTSGHMVSYLYGIPFVAGLLIVEKKKRFSYMLLLAFELFNIFLSGRRAMFLLVGLLPVFGILIYRYIRNKGFKKYRIVSRLSKNQTFILTLACVFGVCVIYYSKNYIIFLLDTLLEGFEFKNAANPDAHIRGIQFSALMKGWLEHPLFGNGAGSYTIECIRSEEQLWAYELSYCALLFQKGLIGAGLFLNLVIHAYRSSKKKIQKNKYFLKYCYPVLMGMTGVLIGNATNPYLGKFSCIWYLFLAVSLSGMLNFKNKDTSEIFSKTN
ncbi:MAG: hypothetical protein HFI83_04980 [Eubacterium sp.]|nr:hypothetical protein [Eubacterium sp.]